MKKNSLLDSIDVPMPCDKSWDEMVGDDVSRFCSRCENDIYNISAMTRQEAKKLLFQSNKKVCIRMERESDGRIKTLKKQLHQITRQVPFATGVLSASLAFSTFIHAQEEIVIGQAKTTVSAPKDKNAITNSTISGTVTDLHGAVVPGAKITLRNVKNNSIRTTTSNDAGVYEFRDVEIGNYEIQVVTKNFKEQIQSNLSIDSAETLCVNIVLAPKTDETVGLYTIENIITTNEQPKLDDKIIPQKIVDLPINSRENLPVLGLFPGTKENSQKLKNQIKTSQISFTIFDPIKEVIPKAEVKLINQKTQEEYTVFTNDAGVATFDRVIKGRFEALVSVPHFKSHKQFVQIKEPIEPNIEITLDVGSAAIGVFVISWSEIPTFNAIIQDDNQNVIKSINAGFNVNTKDSSRKTALHFAVEEGNLEIVQFLLAKGAKVNAKDFFNRTPILMISNDDEENFIEIFKLLIAKGADVNVQDKDDNGMTLLMTVCEDDNFEVAKMLLEAGANPNLRDDDGETAMQKTDSEQIRQILIKYGAKKN